MSIALEELHREHAQLLAIFNGTTSLMWSVDQELRLVIANDVFRRNASRALQRQLAVGDSVLDDRFPEAVRGQWESWYRRALAGEQFVTHSSDEVDGETQYWDHAFAPIRDSAGQVVGVSVVGQDVGDRVRTEQELAHRKRDVHQAQSMARVGSWDWDMRTDAVTMSPVLRELLALPAEGNPPPFEAHERFYTPESWQRLTDAVQDALARGTPYTLDLELTEVVTARWIVAHGEPVRDDAGAIVGLQGVTVDVTERRTAEEQKRHLERMLIQAQKMEAVGQLAGGIAHDFNNMLTALLLQANALLDVPSIAGEIRDGLHDMELEIQRATKLTRQLLMFSRRQALDRRPLELNGLIGGFLRMLTRLIGEQVTLRFESTQDDLLLNGDPVMLEQVVMNLVVNARDAMPVGGSVTVRTRRVSVVEEAANRHANERPGQFVEIEVADTGVGISAEHAERIFEPFYTTKETGKGTGLGLATAYGIVAQHGGWIEFDSVVGGGSTFRVRLPCGKQEDVPSELPRVAESAPSAVAGHVLLVEDEPSLRRLLVRALEREGFTVDAAANGPEAVQLWETHASRIDVVVSDMVLPGGINGLDLLQRFAHAKSDVRQLLMSGYSADIVDGALTARTSIRMLHKPFSALEFARAVREVLETA